MMLMMMLLMIMMIIRASMRSKIFDQKWVILNWSVWWWSYDFDDHDDSNDDYDPGDGVKQYVAEAFEKGRGAAHPWGNYSSS